MAPAMSKIGLAAGLVAATGASAQQCPFQTITATAPYTDMFNAGFVLENQNAASNAQFQTSGANSYCGAGVTCDTSTSSWGADAFEQSTAPTTIKTGANSPLGFLGGHTHTYTDEDSNSVSLPMKCHVQVACNPAECDNNGKNCFADNFLNNGEIRKPNSDNDRLSAKFYIRDTTPSAMGSSPSPYLRYEGWWLDDQNGLKTGGDRIKNAQGWFDKTKTIDSVTECASVSNASVTFTNPLASSSSTYSAKHKCLKNYYAGACALTNEAAGGCADVKKVTYDINGHGSNSCRSAFYHNSASGSNGVCDLKPAYKLVGGTGPTDTGFIETSKEEVSGSDAFCYGGFVDNSGTKSCPTTSDSAAGAAKACNHADYVTSTKPNGLCQSGCACATGHENAYPSVPIASGDTDSTKREKHNLGRKLACVAPGSNDFTELTSGAYTNEASGTATALIAFYAPPAGSSETNASTPEADSTITGAAAGKQCKYLTADKTKTHDLSGNGGPAAYTTTYKAGWSTYKIGDCIGTANGGIRVTKCVPGGYAEIENYCNLASVASSFNPEYKALRTIKAGRTDGVVGCDATMPDLFEDLAIHCVADAAEAASVAAATGMAVTSVADAPTDSGAVSRFGLGGLFVAAAALLAF